MVITGARHKDEILEAVQFIQDELADLLYLKNQVLFSRALNVGLWRSLVELHFLFVLF